MRRVERTSTLPGRRENLPLVLYVEDDDDNWRVAELRLQQFYRLIRAATDREACELLRKHQHELYVVLLDIELRGSTLHGPDLARLSRGVPLERALPDYAKHVPRSSVPLVFVTAYHKQLTPELAAAGGDLLIPKPVRFMELVRCLTDLHLRNMSAKKNSG